VGETKQETIELISEAIEFHIEGLHEDGNLIPTPHCNIAYVEVDTSVWWGQASFIVVIEEWDAVLSRLSR